MDMRSTALAVAMLCTAHAAHAQGLKDFIRDPPKAHIERCSPAVADDEEWELCAITVDHRHYAVPFSGEILRARTAPIHLGCITQSGDDTLWFAIFSLSMAPLSPISPEQIDLRTALIATPATYTHARPLTVMWSPIVPPDGGYAFVSAASPGSLAPLEAARTAAGDARSQGSDILWSVLDPRTGGGATVRTAPGALERALDALACQH